MTDHASAASPALREARLRPAASDQIRWAPAGVWLPASTLAGTALRHAEASGEEDPRARALPEDAFEFRGGRPEAGRRSAARTRRSDHPAPAYGTRRRVSREGRTQP